MIFSVEQLVGNRPVVGYGVGEYAERALRYSELSFDYFIGSHNEKTFLEKPVFSIEKLLEEKRDPVIFIFSRHMAAAIFELSRYGFYWRRNVFDSRYFGVLCNFFNDYELLVNVDAIGHSKSVNIFSGSNTNIEISNLTIPLSQNFKEIQSSGRIPLYWCKQLELLHVNFSSKRVLFRISYL